MEVSEETRGRVPVRLRRRANQPPLLEHYLKHQVHSAVWVQQMR